jgi:hypothetical protein
VKNLKKEIAQVLLLEPQDLAHTDTATAWLDTLGFEGATLSAVIGALTGSDGSNYLTPVLQHSDTTAATAAEAVAAADIEGAFTKVDAANEDSLIQTVGYVGAKRYVRINFDYTGTGISAGIVGAYGTLGHASRRPAVAPAAVAAT